MTEPNKPRNPGSEEGSKFVCESDPGSPEIFDPSFLFTENEDEPQEVQEPLIQETTINNNETAPTDIPDVPLSPIPDLEPQQKLLWTLNHNRYEQFVELLKHPKVNPKFKYTKPQHTDFGTCIEIASRLPDRGAFVKALLESGVKPNIHEIHPEPIHYAAREGNPDTLQILLQDRRTKINALDSFDRTALHHAVKYSKEGRDEKYNQCITMLLKCFDLDINKANKKGFTAIHEAAHKSKEAVELFLHYRYYDLDLDSTRASGRTAREFILIKYPELVSSLPDIRQQKQSSDINVRLLWSLQRRRLKEFTEILQQVDNDGNARVDPNFYYGQPDNATCLEIACKEDDCAEFVKQLLKAGADPNISNVTTKRTPLHTAAELGNHQVLSELLRDRRTNVNAVDNDGRTALHIIAQCNQDDTEKKNIMKCLILILQKRKIKNEEIATQLNLRDIYGQTAAQIALQNGHKKVLGIMLEYAGMRMDLDAILQPQNEKLSDAIRRKFPDLKAKFPIRRDISLYDLSSNLFQLLYSKKTDEFVNMLQNIDENENIDVDDGNYTLLQYATRHGLKEPVKELIKAGANPNSTTDYEKRTPIIIASLRKKHDVLRLLLEMTPAGKLNINAEDAKGNTALHYASKNGDLDCVVDLMSHGANFHHENVFDKPPLPANSVKCFLDNSLKTNDKFPEDEEYELIFDYTFLLAHRKQNLEPYPPDEEERKLIPDPEAKEVMVIPTDRHCPEMDFLFYMSTSKEHRNLMEHPIVTSFLHIKWHRVKMAFYINLIIYALFVTLLNAFIILDVKKDDKDILSKEIREVYDPAAQTCLWLFVIYFTIREICQFTLSPKVYIRNFENVLDFGLIIITVWMLILPHNMPTFLVVIAILLSWSELILLTGRLPKLSRNIEMLKTVSKNYCWFLFSYVFLIIAFAFSFYSLLHKSSPNERRETKEKNGTSEAEEKDGFYTTPQLAILKVFVMMMGEFEASNILPHMKGSENSFICFLLFSLFVFLIAMVLLNLLTGLAVNDTQAIKANAYQLSLVSRIRLIYEIEKNFLQWHRIVENSRSYKVMRPFSCLQRTLFRNITLFPQNSINKRVCILPNKGPEIIFDDGSKSDCKMGLKILRESLAIMSNTGKENEIYEMKQALENIQGTTLEGHDKMLARLNSIDEKLRQTEQDKNEIKDILNSITDMLSQIKQK